MQERIENDLKHANTEQAGHLFQPQFSVPIQQLNMISQILPSLYHTFQQINLNLKQN